MFIGQLSVLNYNAGIMSTLMNGHRSGKTYRFDFGFSTETHMEKLCKGRLLMKGLIGWTMLLLLLLLISLSLSGSDVLDKKSPE